MEESPKTSSVETWSSLAPSLLAASRTLTAPTTLVVTKSWGAYMDLSTWVSAARLIMTSGPNTERAS